MQCQTCGEPMVKTEWAGGFRLVCSGWPACQTTAPLPAAAEPKADAPPVARAIASNAVDRQRLDSEVKTGGKLPERTPTPRGDDQPRNQQTQADRELNRLRNRLASAEDRIRKLVDEKRALETKLRDVQTGGARGPNGPPNRPAPALADQMVRQAAKRVRRLKTRPERLRVALRGLALAARSGVLPPVRRPAPGGHGCSACNATGRVTRDAGRVEWCDACDGHGWFPAV